MAFFCMKSGVRIVAPGVAKSAGGDVAEYVESPVHDLAESAALKAIASKRKSDTETAPSAEALAAAVVAAAEVIETEPKAKAKQPESVKAEPAKAVPVK